MTEMQTKQSTKENLKYRHTRSNLKGKKRIFSLGSLVAFIILISPLFFYVYQLVPATQSIETFFGTVNSNYYEDIQVLTWVSLGKFVPLVLLLIWFFTCKHWWYHVIIVPIIVMSYQFITSLNGDVIFLDYDDIYFLIPVIALVAAFSYGIRTRIFDSIYGIDIDEDLKRVRWNGKIVKVPANSPLDLEEVGDDEIDDEDEDDDKEPMWMA